MFDGHFWAGVARPERRAIKLVLRREGEVLAGRCRPYAVGVADQVSAGAAVTSPDTYLAVRLTTADRE